NTLTPRLANGKSKRILSAEGLLKDLSGPFGGPARMYALGITVNGLPMQPFGFDNRILEDCGVVRPDPDGYCAVTGHWWLDMDDPANAALLGVPIATTLVGGDYFGGLQVGNPIDMSLRVRLEKK